MAIMLDSLRADTRRENDGDWVEIPEYVGVALKVRGYAYGPFQAAKSIVEARWARKYGTKEPAPFDVQYRENGRLYAEHLLLDWRGFVDANKNEIPFNREMIYDILTDPAYRELHDHIRYATNKLSQVDVEYVETASGNSSRSSAGNSAQAA